MESIIVMYSPGRGLPVLKNNSNDSHAAMHQHGGKCSCGLPNAKFCMLNLVDVIENVKKSKPRQSWVPLNICSAYT